jgi:type II secretory pathway pseudopilin PulG
MSLVELVTALVILAVLLGLAYPSWQRFQAHQSLRYAAAQVATDLREAQERAKAERREYRATFVSGSSQYTVERSAGGFHHVADLPRGVTVVSGAVVTFSSFGRPDGAYTLTLQNPAGTATVTVTGGGGIQYQAP